MTFIEKPFNIISLMVVIAPRDGGPPLFARGKPEPQAGARLVSTDMIRGRLDLI